MANDNGGQVTIDGYLEKKGKMKVVTTWKKYWFVLKGGLLLYYRSQEEYIKKLSACKGSINLGLVTDIRTGLSTIGVFQIITRTNTITLRAKENIEQKKWLQALVDATGQQNVSSPVKMSHFRYSMDDLTPTNGKKILLRQNTLPNRFKNKIHRRNSIINRIKQIGGQTYVGSLDTMTRLTEEVQKYELKTDVKERRNTAPCDICANNNKQNDELILKETENSACECDTNKPDQDEVFCNNDLYMSSKNLKDRRNSKTKWFDSECDNNQNGVILQNDLKCEEKKDMKSKLKIKISNLFDKSEKTESTSSETSTEVSKRDSGSSDEIILRNNLYATVNKDDKKNERLSEVIVVNTEYITSPLSDKEFPLSSEKMPTNNSTSSLDSYQYIANIDVKKEINPELIDDAEYYCTYEDLQTSKPREISHIYNDIEPSLPPRHRQISESEDKASSSSKEEKPTRLQKFKQKFRKRNKTSLREKSADLIKRVIGKKKEQGIAESDIAEYAEPDEILRRNNEKIKDLASGSSAQGQVVLVQTLMELHNMLEDKKEKMKEIIQISKSNSPRPMRKLPQPEEEEQEEVIEVKEEKEPTKEEQNGQITDENPPGLPPRRLSKRRSVSPFHDIPKNIPIPNNEELDSIRKNYSIDKILEELKILETKQITTIQSPQEELSVKQLINKFNHFVDIKVDSIADVSLADVAIRKKDTQGNNDLIENIIANRHSDELNKLLEELTKVTCAPLLTPGATSSLVQMKSDGLTDEEWLAITPIRRRRHSEPDYDVPRPHRSLQILPRSPDKEDETSDIVIPATRFFGPVLPNTDDKSTEQSLTWRSMTPDSLEPIYYYNKYRNQEINGNCIEKDRCSDIYERVSCRNSYEEKTQNNNLIKCDSYHQISNLTEIKSKSNENFLDSLEPFVEVSTVF